MATVYACGWGCKMITGAGFGGIAHWQAAGGAGQSIDATVPGPGVVSGQSLLIDTTGATSQAYVTRALPASTRTHVARFYFRVDTAPSVGGTVYATTTTGVGHIVLLANRTLQARATTGGTLVGTTVLALSQWYCIDLMIVTTGTTWTVDWQIDGVDQPQASTGSQVASDMGFIRVGWGTTSMIGEVRYAHLLLANNAADYPLGEGTVEGFAVASTGTHSFTAGDFQDHSSTNLGTTETASHANVDELPPTIAEHVKQVVIRTTGYLEYKYATGAAGRAPLAVEQGFAVHNIGTQANTQKGQLYDGTTATDAYALTSSGSVADTMGNGSKHWTAAPSGAWTGTLFDLLKVRWGFSGDVTHVPALDSTWLEAAFLPTVASEAVDPMGMAGFFGV